MDAKIVSTVLISVILGSMIGLGLSYAVFNSQIQSLQTDLADTKNSLLGISSTVNGVRDNVTGLQKDLSDTLSKLNSINLIVNKIANETITNVKLAAQAIPFVSTYTTDFNTTTETEKYVDVNGMSVNLSLNRKSHLLILFNVEAYASEGEWITIRALVGQDVAYPGEIYLTPNIYGSLNVDFLVDWAAYGYNFYQPSVNAGTYTIKIQWIVSDGIGYIADRTLTVVALPE